MIFLTGAGGKTGRAVVKALSNIGSVCAFVHREEHVSALHSLGAERVIVGDLHDQDAIQSAMQGARRVYHICPNMNPNESEIGRLVIGAARESGVEHFVYHSVLHPQTQRMTHHWQKMRVEEMIFESRLSFTILQPAPYMQNLLAGWKSILEDGSLRLPYSMHAKFSFLDLEDLAEAAKIVLTEPNHRNAVYELAGTPPMSHVDVAQTFARVLGREVQAVREEIKDWRLRVSEVSAYALENLVRMFEYYDQWGLPGNPNVLQWILKREPMSLEAFVKRTASENSATA